MRKKFIIYCLLFFTPLVIILITLEILTLELPSNFKANQSALNTKKDTFNTLVLGSSQMMMGINAQKIDSPTLNLASGSQHHDTDFKLLKSIRPRLINLKTVVLEVSYSHFELPHNGTNFWKNPLYLKYFNVNMFERKTYFTDDLIFISNPPFFFNHLRDFYIKKDPNFNINEYGFNTKNYSGSFKTLNYNESDILTKTKIDINTKENLFLVHKNSKLFFKMLDYLNDEGLNIIICKVPMYNTFLNSRNNSILKRRDSILLLVSKKYKNIEVLDLEEDTINFKAIHYKNESHLNPDGAEIFTRKLNGIINKID